MKLNSSYHTFLALQTGNYLIYGKPSAPNRVYYYQGKKVFLREQTDIKTTPPRRSNYL
jgi:hypothetical protein